MTENEQPKLGGQLGAELIAETSRLLRQARRMRKLSITEAAKQLEISPFYLKALEDGTENHAINIVSRILRHYGFHDLNFMDLFNELMLGKALRDRHKKTREHLSVVGADPKPWERLPDSLSAARNGKLSDLL